MEEANEMKFLNMNVDAESIQSKKWKWNVKIEIRVFLQRATPYATPWTMPSPGGGEGIRLVHR